MNDINSGPGWYEVINPRNATTRIAHVHEDGSLYLPEGPDALTETEFAFAAARGNAHRLVRVDDDDASCSATFREEPMPDTVYCGEKGYRQRHTAWQGSDYYAWLDGDEGAGWDLPR